MSTQETTDTRLASVIAAAVPTGLNDIVRAHRDEVSLYLATETQLVDLAAVIDPQEPIREELSDWYFVVSHLHLTQRNQYFIELLGYVGRRTWITSPVVAIDWERGRVRTENSLYGIDQVCPGEGEPDGALLRALCARLNETALGPYLGVPGWSY